MSKAFVFWLLMLLWLLFSGWLSWGTPQFAYHFGGSLLQFLLLGLLGWQTFGRPIQ